MSAYVVARIGNGWNPWFVTKTSNQALLDELCFLSDVSSDDEITSYQSFDGDLGDLEFVSEDEVQNYVYDLRSWLRTPLDYAF